MKRASTKLPQRASLALLALMCACASGTGTTDPAAYAAVSCADLDVSIGETSKTLSSVAIRRGRVERLDIPVWVLGGDKAAAAVKARQTDRIERLEARLEAMRNVRQAKCR